MAYIGTGGQFDSGLTNPSRGRFGFLNNQAQLNQQGTKPLPITQGLTQSPKPASGVSGTTLPAQPTDQYWPWQLPATQGPQSLHNSGISWNDTNEKITQKPAYPEYIPPPEFPDMAKNPNPIVGATPAEYMKYNPNYWKEPDIAIPEAGVDTRAIVDSTKHFLDEEMAGGMGDAARRFGALGGLRSTGYEDTLGDVQRKRDLDLASEYYKWDYNAAQADADRKSRAREGTLGRAYSGWDAEQNRIFNDLASNNDFNLKQQQIANEIAKANQGNEQFIASEENDYGLKKYGAGLSEAERKQMYNLLKMQFGG